MSRLHTAPIGGTRDYLATDVLRRSHIIETVERVYQRYGFEPLETPAMERLSTLLGKYGEEGDQLLFRVLKRGDSLRHALADSPSENTLSDEGLRYDLTVPLARVVAEYGQQLPPIFKRYQIQPVFRADRPARGRFREFYQCDVDIVGTRSLVAEAEVIAALAQVLQELGFAGAEDFSVRLNHRAVLQGFIEAAGVAPETAGGVIVAMDKLDKIGLAGVERELLERGAQPSVAASLLGHMRELPTGNHDILCWLDDLLQRTESGRQGVADLRTIVGYTAYGPAADRVRVDPYLARGLSYYTGSIFEIAFPGVSGSGGGGGRYDNLLGMFSGKQVPACGFSLGLERILLLMTERGMFPDQMEGQPQALVTQFDESSAGASLSLANRLRQSGLRVDLYPDMKGYGAQFRYAERRKIRYALLIGPREVEERVVAAKDLATGEQVDVPADEIADWLIARV